MYKNGKTDRQRIHSQIRNWFLNSSFPRFRDGSCQEEEAAVLEEVFAKIREEEG